VLADRSGSEPRALLIRVRAHGFELPKGHVEEGETPEEAAIRELREETGLVSAVMVGRKIGAIEYSFPWEGAWINKQVVFFRVSAEEAPLFDPMPERTREMRWVTADELSDIQLVSEDLRPIILGALTE
jgi:8-oxo-dGTP pyrophosphatase MutT (NUDIX family)